MSCRILIVEDDDIGRRTLANVLKGLGYEVVSANGVEEALVILREDKGIDVVVTDLCMPTFGDGLLLLNTIRNVLKLKTPTILVSGSDFDDDQRKETVEPFDGFVEKGSSRTLGCIHEQIQRVAHC